LGWPVLPLRGKKPVTSRGVYDATVDVSQVERWWEEADYNVGLAVPHWCVVLDVDPRNGGDQTLQRLCREVAPLPPTLTAETGGGGLHLWFRTCLQPSEVRSPGDGLDVKRRGGYVVAPPSVHPATGELYRWQDEGVALAVLSTSWERRLHRPASVNRVVSEVTDPLAARDLSRWWNSVLRYTPEGNRNHQLFVSALRLAQAGLLTAEPGSVEGCG